MCLFAQQKAMQIRDQKEALVMARSPGATRQKMPGVRPGCPKLARLSWRASPDLNASSEPWGQLSLRMRGEGESYTQ